MDLTPTHNLRIALVHPQIAPNTGNIGRLCVATGTALHLVRPLGFLLDDRNLRRAGMDFWPRLNLTVHDDLDAFESAIAGQRIWLFTSKAQRSHWDADYAPGDWLIFGSETHGLPESFTHRHPDRTLRIPQLHGERCLNLSTAAGIGLYEALRQVVCPPQLPRGSVNLAR
jgi:tRNA (cytidine/uridine-2'-O-)-methyltransferase